MVPLGVPALALLVCFSLLLLLLWRRRGMKGKGPPGPTPLPLLGNLLQIDLRSLPASFLKLQEKYGPVFTVHFGPQQALVLCGYEAVKEALVDHSEVFGVRHQISTGTEDYGVGSSNGERWKQLRRFAISTLRDFGMGKRSIEERIQEEARCLVAALQKKEGRPFDPSRLLRHSVSNVICSVVFGRRFEYDDEEFILMNLLYKTMQVIDGSWIPLKNILPGLMKFLPGPHKKMSRYLKQIMDVMNDEIQKHQESLDLNSPRDFIDCFLIKMEQERENSASEFHQKNLAATMSNLFFAGTETVSITLQYGLLLLLRYPEVEAKVREEIDRVTGRNRSPRMEDRYKMPFTVAVIHEIQRFADATPLGVLHLLTTDTEFRGFTIPKGTIVFPFLSSVLNAPQHFETPHKFNPGHFLDEHGAFKKNEAFLPFSAGKRVCLGESLARMELFLFLTIILQNFHLMSLQDRKEIDIFPKVYSNVKRPQPYQLCMIPRQGSPEKE